jgi:hypothetical protein
MKLLLLVTTYVFLASPVQARSFKIYVVDSGQFDDPASGITTLVQAIRFHGCSNDGIIKEMQCLNAADDPIVEKLSASLKAFSEQRDIRLLFDLQDFSHCIIEDEPTDVTSEFVQEFNRMNPVTLPRQSDKRLQPTSR